MKVNGILGWIVSMHGPVHSEVSIATHLLGKVDPATLFMEVSFLAKNESQRLEK